MEKFAYSTEEGTVAASMGEHVPEGQRVERRARVLAQQRGISLARNRVRIGRELEVLIDSVDPERGIAWGRHGGQAPEIDGQVILTLPERGNGHRADRWSPGSLIRARIRGAGPYDLVAGSEEGTPIES